MSEISPIEAITNIGANLLEIVGIAGGSCWLLWCWVPVVNKVRGYGRKMFFVGLALIVSALAGPVLVDKASGINKSLALAVSILLAVPIVGGGVYAYFLPSRIAKERNHPNEDWIWVLNWFFFIPFNFLIMLVWATWPSKGGPPKADGTVTNQGDG